MRRPSALSAGRPASSVYRADPSTSIVLDRWDALCLGALLLLWFSLLVLHYSSLPLQTWDEARNANNALEIARSGHWLVPSYEGIPDHWNTKPPLMIWQMSALMRLGLPPLLAVRLPTMLAALATVGAVWGVCRYALRDRAAAAIAGFLLLSSLYYTNIHVARTGDYDVPLSFVTLCYVLAFWVSVERRDTIRISWFAISAGGLVLAVMTKGIAGGFALPGLFVFSLVSGRLVLLLNNIRVWLLAIVALTLCLGYYGSREAYDPGYLQAIWDNELSSFQKTLEGHAEGLLYYIRYLLNSFEPGVLFMSLAVLPVLGSDDRRRSMAVLCLSCAATLLAVITAAQTKLYWYLTPSIPFLAIAAGLGVSDGLRWIKAREPQLPRLLRERPLTIAIAILMAVTSAISLYRNHVVKLIAAQQASHGQLWYSGLFDELRTRGGASRVVVFAGGPENIENYNPALKFYAEIAQMQGLAVRIARFDTPVAANEMVATCDPKLVPFLQRWEHFTMDVLLPHCVVGFVSDSQQSEISEILAPVSHRAAAATG